MSISFETRDFLLEELVAETGLDDSIPTEIDDGYYDSEGDILYLEQFLNEDTSSDLSLTLLPKESSLLVQSLPDSKQICLREMERFDPFFSLTLSGYKFCRIDGIEAQAPPNSFSIKVEVEITNAPTQTHVYQRQHIDKLEEGQDEMAQQVGFVFGTGLSEGQYETKK
nr:hypothetical protein [Tanacetum cinerariifolium]